MSPVCKKCRNYVMKFPCPHCGSDMKFTDRDPDEIKPIIPVDLQESFKKPPPPVNTSDSSFIPPYQPPMSPKPKLHDDPAPTPHVSPPPVPLPSTEPLNTTLDSFPSTPSPRERLPPSISQRGDQVPPPAPPMPSVIVSKDDTETPIHIDDINDHFKQLKSHLKEISSRQKRYESQAKKFESNFNEIDKKLKKIEKSLKIILKTNQKLQSIHKDTSKDLKKTL